MFVSWSALVREAYFFGTDSGLHSRSSRSGHRRPLGPSELLKLKAWEVLAYSGGLELTCFISVRHERVSRYSDVASLWAAC